jgi:hypothetical protein
MQLKPNNMKIIILSALSFVILLCSCQNGRNETKLSDSSASNSASDTTGIANKSVHIDYNNLESFKSENGIHTIDIPKGLFKLTNENEYYSNILKSKIIFYFSETAQIDEPDAIWEKKDLINKMKENTNVTYIKEKKDWVIVSGTNSKGEIVYKKGIYFKPADNHMGENGRNTQPYCFTSVLEITYPTEQKSHFDKLIPILIKSFKCDFLSQCINCF